VKFFSTSLFASSSNLAVSFSLSQISYSSAIFFTFIILSFFGFFFSFFFCFFSCFFPSFSFLSSFFFSYPNFLYFGLYCFSHSSEYLVIFTSPILQSISELWQVSYNILKITFYFCSPITSISILSLYSQ